MVNDQTVLGAVKHTLESAGTSIIENFFRLNRIGQQQEFKLSTNGKMVQLMMHTLGGFHYREGYDSVLLTDGLYPVVVGQDFTDPRDFFMVVAVAEPVMSDDYYMTHVMKRDKAWRDLIVVNGFGDVEVADGYHIAFDSNSDNISTRDPLYSVDFFFDVKTGQIKDRAEMKLSEPTHQKLHWGRV